MPTDLKICIVVSILLKNVCNLLLSLLFLFNLILRIVPYKYLLNVLGFRIIVSITQRLLNDFGWQMPGWK